MKPHNRYLLLDLGHPMSNNTVNVIKVSLQNVFTLATAFPGNSDPFWFGISVINSTFTITESVACLKENYNSLITKLEDLNKKLILSDKVTVQEYKHLLRVSIEVILPENKIRAKKLSQKKDLVSPQSQEQIQITVVTKKTASLVGEMLMDVINKSETLNKVTSTENFKIIQILNEPKKSMTMSKISKNSIDWNICPENLYDIDCVLKHWLLQSTYEQQLGIILSEDTDLIVKCDIDSCVINLASSAPSEERFGLHNNLMFGALDNSTSFGNPTPSMLKIIHRIPLSDLCLTPVFGIPHRAHATHNYTFSWNELQVNLQIFKKVCQLLLQTQVGFLAKANSQSESNEISWYYFITSNGDTLLINNIAPSELYLPKCPENFKFDSEIDPNVASLVENSFRKIKVLEKYSPSEFSSGMHEYLKSYLMQTAQKSSLLRNIDPYLTLSGRNSPAKRTKARKRRPRWSVLKNDSANEKLNAETVKNLTGRNSQTVKKERKPGNEIESENVHPALLSPKIIEKYRKPYSSVFSLPELGEAYSQNLI